MRLRTDFYVKYSRGVFALKEVFKYIVIAFYIKVNARNQFNSCSRKTGNFKKVI